MHYWCKTGHKCVSYIKYKIRSQKCSISTHSNLNSWLFLSCPVCVLWSKKGMKHYNSFFLFLTLIFAKPWNKIQKKKKPKNSKSLKADKIMLSTKNPTELFFWNVITMSLYVFGSDKCILQFLFSANSGEEIGRASCRERVFRSV